jgi:Phasin protein
MAKSTRVGQGGAGDGETAAASAKATVDAASVVAAGLQDVVQVWIDYAQQMMHRTAEATESLMKCRGFNDVLAVQAELMRRHLEAFLEQSTKLARSLTGGQQLDRHDRRDGRARRGRQKPAVNFILGRGELNTGHAFFRRRSRSSRRGSAAT